MSVQQKRRPKVVMWDIGNVLVRAFHERTVHRLVELGVGTCAAKKFFSDRSYADFARGQINGPVFHDLQVNEVLCADLSIYYLRQAHDCHIVEAIPEALDLVARCNVRVAFATSTNPWQNYRVDQLIGDLSRFNPIYAFRSCEAGMLKTDPGCWNYIAPYVTIGGGRAILNEEVLLIDDSADNRAAAETVGFQTYAYTPNDGAADCERFLLELGLLD